MVLSKQGIEEAIAAGKIIIEPFDASHLKEASYTFTLQEDIALEPDDFVVATTKEKILLTGDICCFLSTRGSIAQQGVDALQGSTFVEPLSDNQLKLEIKNNSTKAITLVAGTKIVKGIFVKVG